jgi:hypothetical protein
MVKDLRGRLDEMKDESTSAELESLRKRVEAVLKYALPYRVNELMRATLIGCLTRLWNGPNSKVNRVGFDAHGARQMIWTT